MQRTHLLKVHPNKGNLEVVFRQTWPVLRLGFALADRHGETSTVEFLRRLGRHNFVVKVDFELVCPFILLVEFGDAFETQTSLRQVVFQGLFLNAGEVDP